MVSHSEFSPAVVPTPDFPTTGLTGRRVLLVEDNAFTRELIRAVLEAWGVELTEAHDGPTGLVRLETQHYDLVLMDLQLPGLSGLELTRRLRRLPDPRRAATPVLGLSATVFPDDLARCRAAGLNDLLAKPFQRQVLYDKLLGLTPGMDARPYDLSRLHDQAQGHAAFVPRLLRAFLAHTPASLDGLAAAAAAARWAEAAAIAHHLKPNLLTLNITDIKKALGVLEQIHHPTDVPPTPAALRAAVAQLVAVVGRVLAALPAELAAAESSAAGRRQAS